MKLEEKNQLFINSIWHWYRDGIDMYDEGLELSILANYVIQWSDGQEVKLGAQYCPLCGYFFGWTGRGSGGCKACFLECGQICCAAYEEFLCNPCRDTCQGVIEYLWKRAFEIPYEQYRRLDSLKGG